MPLLRRVAFCQKGGSSQTFVKKLRAYPGGRAGLKFSKCPASGLRIKTEIKGFPRNRTQTGGAGRAGILKVPGIRFAYQNRNQRVSEESYANRRRLPGLQAFGWRSTCTKKLLRISGTAFFLLELLKWLITEREP